MGPGNERDHGFLAIKFGHQETRRPRDVKSKRTTAKRGGLFHIGPIRPELVNGGFSVLG